MQKSILTIEDFKTLVKNAKIEQDHHCDDNTDTYRLGHNSEGKDIFGEYLGGTVWSTIEILGTIFEFTKKWGIAEDEKEITYWEHEDDLRMHISGIIWAKTTGFEVMDEAGEFLEKRKIFDIIKDTVDVYDFNLSYNFENEEN